MEMDPELNALGDNLGGSRLEERAAITGLEPRVEDWGAILREDDELEAGAEGRLVVLVEGETTAHG